MTPRALASISLLACLLSSLASLSLSGCGPRGVLPEPSALQAEKPTLRALLWWLPAEVQTLSVALGPFQIPGIDALPAPTLSHINQAASLTLLRNLDGGRFFAGWTQSVLLLGVDLRAAYNPELDAQPSAQLLVFDQPISDRDWLSLEGDASDAAIIEGALVQRHVPQVRGREWPIWLAKPTPHVLILSDDLPLLTALLARRLNPDHPRALDPDHPAWLDLPLVADDVAWSLSSTPNLTVWATEASADGLSVLIHRAPSDSPPQTLPLKGDADVLTLLRALGYWVAL
jgi:hypothetical protein